MSSSYAVYHLAVLCHCVCHCEFMCVIVCVIVSVNAGIIVDIILGVFMDVTICGKHCWSFLRTIYLKKFSIYVILHVFTILPSSAHTCKILYFRVCTWLCVHSLFFVCLFFVGTSLCDFLCVNLFLHTCFFIFTWTCVMKS